MAPAEASRQQNGFVLVTGAAGFIGSHLAERLLLAGASVLAVDNFDPYYARSQKELHIEAWRDHERVRFVEADIRRLDVVAGLFDEHPIESVVHLAARAGVRASVDTPHETLDTNIRGTLNILEAMRRGGVGDLVLGTSSSVYGDSPVPFREDAPADRPLQPYAASKRAAEMLAYSYAHLHGLRITSARLFSVYGPRMRPDLAIHKFARLIAAGAELPILGDGTASRDYTYVSDIVDGVVAAMRARHTFEIVNLGSSEAVPLSRVIDLLAERLGKEARRRYLPSDLSDARITCADTSKAHRLFGYAPKVTLEEGISQFVEWYLANRRRLPAE